MAKVISIGNMKGGVGKTTSAVHLAQQLGRKGKTLLLDADEELQCAVYWRASDFEGWTFEAGFPGATGDRLMDLRRLHEVYQRADPRATTKVTVPVLWDAERGTIVSNESAEIIRMMTSAWDGLTGNDLDLWPEALRDEIEAVNARVYDTLNNGVYRAGFAASVSGVASGAR